MYYFNKLLGLFEARLVCVMANKSDTSRPIAGDLASLTALLWGTDIKDDVFRRWTQGKQFKHVYLMLKFFWTSTR